MIKPLEMRPQFTGVFIPAGIWLHPQLNCVERCLLAEIGALGGHRGECSASNEYLGRHVGVGAHRVSVMIKHLIELGLLESTSFDGRERLLRSFYDVKAAMTKKSKQPRQKSQSSLVENVKEGTADPVTKTKKEDAVFPAKLQSDAFAAAWKDWLEDRRVRRKPVTALAASRQLKQLSIWGESKAISAINLSIANGWQGLFEPGDRGKKVAEAKSDVHPLDDKYDHLEDIDRWPAYQEDRARIAKGLKPTYGKD